MKFRILGPVGYEIEGQFHSMRGSRQRTLLATLLVSGGRPVPAEQLYTELWGESPPTTAHNSLQAHIYRLRGTLQRLPVPSGMRPRVTTRASGYALEHDTDNLDMTVFRSRIAQSRHLVDEDPHMAYKLLDDALDLWRGSPMQDVAAGPMCQSVALQLDEEYMTALEDKLWLGIGCQDPTHVIGELKRMSSVHPWRERITEMLMLALYRCGRQAEAIEAYNSARRRLVDELGMEPSVQLRQRFRDILNQAPSLREFRPSNF
ncbi:MULTISPECIES: BTAD domain-containing putative transcriptional regulator [unclassified Streptomyces]|jgi:DNA-binding SARP family transcriptional activator|uniref:AfsR/SARP family transcriptional regulator n=1 Tax=unclassified Streptomyces TaxID=2593676 RepID=UPI0038285D07